MQKLPLYSVKQAAEILQLDENAVRQRLISGELQGEKRSIGWRTKWFVYEWAIEAHLARTGDEEQDVLDFSPEEPIADMEEDLSIDSEYLDDEDPEGWLEANRERVKLLAEQLVRPLIDKMDTQAEVIFEQRRVIQEQEHKLHLLPDLEQKSASLQLQLVENEFLKKQVAALQEQLEDYKLPWWKRILK